ncbi:hypothetical protein A4G19_12775 [Pasteurellaceae bacterium Macca]|nr:hypothetical protein [Pasteurellaceae bacterium Macca]
MRGKIRDFELAKQYKKFVEKNKTFFAFLVTFSLNQESLVAQGFQRVIKNFSEFDFITCLFFTHFWQ